ncbi:hypothetical protein LY56_03552 [Roseinatronobacter thiooxidans]|uniref:Uncharacterized protein n=1 Tax=Roseinatronobacter thiooxidans TaxID=121821 RepID=A0A2W7RE01_9RHOB|nr:hypothetical protein LY56_03552 [Roseinatronobacter thiooxidans]
MNASSRQLTSPRTGYCSLAILMWPTSNKTRRNPLRSGRGQGVFLFPLTPPFPDGTHFLSDPGPVRVRLRLHIGPNDLKGGSAAGDDAVAGGPEAVPPEDTADLRPPLLAQAPGGDPLQAADQLRQRELGRVRDQEVDVIPVRFHRLQRRPHVRGDRSHDPFQEVPDPVRPDRVPPVLGRKDQVSVQTMNDVPSCSEI